MTPELAAGVLAYAASVWTNADLPETAVHAWADATGDIDPTAAHTAMRRLAQTSEFMPTIARFLAEVRLVNREHARPAIAAGPIPHSTRREASARMRALKDAWSQAAQGRPPHDHKRGDEACPACSTTDDWLTEHAADIAAVLREHPVGVIGEKP